MAVTLDQVNGSRRRRRWAATSSPTTRPSRSGRPSHLPAIRQALDTPPEGPRRRWGCTCTSRSAASGASSATSASTPTRTPTRSRRTCRPCRGRSTLYARPRGSAGAAVRVRLLRRRDAVVTCRNEQLERLVERINQRWRWDAAKEVTFECEPGTLKESQAPDDQGDRRHAAVAWASSTSTTRSCRSTAGRTSRRRSTGRTTGPARSASRRSTST